MRHEISVSLVSTIRIGLGPEKTGLYLEDNRVYEVFKQEDNTIRFASNNSLWLKCGGGLEGSEGRN